MVLAESSLISSLNPLCLHKIGQVTLRGMIDESVTADVVRLNVKLVDG